MIIANTEGFIKKFLATYKGFFWLKIYVTHKHELFFESNIEIPEELRKKIEWETVPIMYTCVFNEKPLHYKEKVFGKINDGEITIEYTLGEEKTLEIAEK